MTSQRDTESTLPAAGQAGFWSLLLVVLLGRTVANTSFRIVYPFLPSIARGLGISLKAAGALVTLRVVTNLATPFFGPLADWYGRRRVMAFAMLLFALASLILAGFGTFAAAVVAFALYGIVKAFHDPASHAYVGDAVPYRERGRAVGVVELSWAISWLVGVPVSGFLIERFGWRAPWASMILLGVIGLWLTLVGLPRISRSSAVGDRLSFVASMVRTWRDLLRDRSVVVLLLVSFLLALSIETPFIVYGAWLEDAFGLSLGTLGLASTVVGLAEAAAELGAVGITDRLGKRRSVLVGLIGLVVSFVALPGLSQLGLVAALGGVALMMLMFEFALVSLLPMATELVPNARASLLGLTFTALNLARILGAYIGGALWQGQDLTLHAALGAIWALIAVLLMWRGVREIE